jgi:hypothetical protein
MPLKFETNTATIFIMTILLAVNIVYVCYSDLIKNDYIYFSMFYSPFICYEMVQIFDA